MQIFFGADHGGFELKNVLLSDDELTASFSQVKDLGALEFNPADDYPQFGFSVARAVAQTATELESNPQKYGVLVCRSGGGIAIAANRVVGARAVVCRSEADVVHARAHNNANILVLEGDRVEPETARKLILLFCQTAFEGGRHTSRVIALG